MSWTDDRVALLKKMWVEGRTAAEIAKELGGVTRNAVIGKAHRLKLSNRVSPIQQNKKPVIAKVPEKKAEKIVIHDNNEPGISLLDLKSGACRWPKGDPREENFGFCGCTAIPGLPYCPTHAKIAYQAATRNRILQAEDFEDKNATVAVAEDDAQETKVAANSR
jgi:GcrA cell cycle regulator